MTASRRKKPAKFHEIPFGNVSKTKARRMLHEGSARGKPLSRKQRGAPGARAKRKRY